MATKKTSGKTAAEPRLPGFFEDYGGYAIHNIVPPKGNSVKKPAGGKKPTATAKKK